MNNTFKKYQHKLISTVRKTKKKLTHFLHSQHLCGTFTLLELFTRIYDQRIALCWKFWKLCNFKTKASIAIERHIWYISTVQNNIYRSNEESPTSQSLSWSKKLSFLTEKAREESGKWLDTLEFDRSRDSFSSALFFLLW